MNKELLKGLTKEQIAKVKQCKTSKEFINLARNEGVELTDEQLQAVIGGCGGGGSSDDDWEGWSGKCPKCGSTNLSGNGGKFLGENWVFYMVCNDCGNQWDQYVEMM